MGLLCFAPQAKPPENFGATAYLVQVTVEEFSAVSFFQTMIGWPSLSEVACKRWPPAYVVCLAAF